MKVSAALVPLFALLSGAPPACASQAQVMDTVALVDNGPAANRITVELIGDGYTSAELPRFRAQADSAWRAISSVEPFRS